MAINPLLKYVGRITAATLNYPYGSSKNETSPGAGDGTPYELARADDIFGFQQALLESAQITPSNNSETALVSEYLEAIVEVASGRAINYDESGAVDAYVLDVQANQQGPRSLFDGQIFKFFPGNTNTGACTANPHSLGVTPIKLVGGLTDPGAGVLATGLETTLVYRSTPAAHLELQSNTAGFAKGVITFAALASNASAENTTVAHGLGTDDIDFGAKIVGSVVADQCAAVISDVNDFNLLVRAATGVLSETIGTTPTAGNLTVKGQNTSSGVQDVTVHWWARRR